MKNVILCCRFNFYDGPPFATGLPHYGHILAGTIKDVVTRFAHQSGFHVDRRFGWDCHGLPVVCVLELPTDVSVGSSFRAVTCSSVMFLLLLHMALLLKGKWMFCLVCCSGCCMCGDFGCFLLVTCPSPGTLLITINMYLFSTCFKKYFFSFF